MSRRQPTSPRAPPIRRGAILPSSWRSLHLKPGDALLAMTLLLACALMVGGLFRIIGSLMDQFPSWGWTLVGGVINLLLGIYVYSLWPFDGFLVLGLFVGIDLIFTGWTWVMLALALKDLGRPARAAPV